MNTALIISATIWRLMSYVFRASLLGLSVFLGLSLAGNILLLASVIVFCFVFITTVRISEMNAMAEAAQENLLFLATWLDRMLWVLAVLTLSSGLFNVTGI